MHPAILLLIVLLLIVLACLIAVKFFGAKFGGKIFENDEENTIEYGIMNVALNKTLIASNAYIAMVGDNDNFDGDFSKRLYLIELYTISEQVVINSTSTHLKYGYSSIQWYTYLTDTFNKLKESDGHHDFNIIYYNLDIFMHNNSWFKVEYIDFIIQLYNDMNISFVIPILLHNLIKRGLIIINSKSQKIYANSIMNKEMILIDKDAISKFTSSLTNLKTTLLQT